MKSKKFMLAEEIKEVLDKHRLWLHNMGGKRADLRGTDLHGVDLGWTNLCKVDLSDADLSGANLHGAVLCEAFLRRADLHGADLHGANLHGADLRGANLYVADLHRANLSKADLSGADLNWANLYGADLRGADLHGAKTDYSCLPLWCGSLDVKIDKRIAAQLMYHALRALQSVEGDADISAVLSNADCTRLANRFHRVKECGKIGQKEKNGGRTPKAKAKSSDTKKKTT